jgi:type I restriction enzyme S subunit
MRYKLADVVEFNPTERLPKGTIAKKVAMGNVQTFSRDIYGYEVEPYNGGAKFRNGDTIMARITPCLENGKSSYISFLDDGEVGYGSTEFIVWRARKGVTDSDYIYYLSQSPEIRDVAVKSMVGSSGRQRVQQTVLDNFEIDLPPLAEQIEIGRTLSALDAKIAANTAVNHNLEQTARAIFVDMFPNTSKGNCSVGDYISPKRGKTLIAKDAVLGNVPVVAGGLAPAVYHNVSNTQEPVVTISASGANAGFVNLWHIPVWCSDSSFIDKTMTDDVYFWYVLLTEQQNKIYESQTGSAQPHIYPRHIESLPTIPLNSDQIKDFTEQATPLFEAIGNNLADNARLAAIRDSLLPKLMSGELTIGDG